MEGEAKPAAAPEEVRMTPQAMKAVVVENNVGRDQRGETFLVFTPQSMCCNCGTTEQIEPVFTHYIQSARMSVSEDDKLEFHLALPHCEDCALNAHMYGASCWGKATVGIIMFVVLMKVCSWLMPARVDPIGVMIPVFILWPILVPLVLRVLAQPMPPKTAVYRPVKIKEFDSAPPDVKYIDVVPAVVTWLSFIAGWIADKLTSRNPHAIETLTFNFSNPDYARAFARVNGERLRSGTMRIKNMSAAAINAAGCGRDKEM